MPRPKSPRAILESALHPTTAPSTLKRRLLTALALCAWTYVSTVAAQYLIAYLFAFTIDRTLLDTPLWTAIYSALTYVLALVLVVLVPIKLFKKWRTSREELGLTGAPTWIDLGLAPAAFIIYLVIAGILTAIFQNFPWFDVEQAQDVGFNLLNSGLDRIIAFISLVVIAPIAEELIFRGWLYGKLRARLSLIPAILLTSLLFGFMHGQWNVGVNVFAMSIVLCLQRETTGTIYSGILLHMLKNGIAFCLLYLA